MIIDPHPASVKQLNLKTCINCSAFENQFHSDATIKSVINIEAGVQINQLSCQIRNDIQTTHRIRFREISAKCLDFISNVYAKIKCISAKRLDFVYIGSSDEVKSVIFNFTQDDIIGGKLIRTHNLDSPIVDVSIIDSNGIEIMTQHIILNNNTVESDFSSINVIGTWKILFEA